MASSPVIAVTGANGYVGRLLVRVAATVGEVTSLVRIPKGDKDRPWSLEMTEQEMARLLIASGATHVVHAAWNMRASSREQLESSCIAGTRRLLNAAKTAGVRQFIFISTISAFEGASSLYGQAKLAAEQLVKEAGGLVLRLGLVYGNSEGGMFGSLSKIAARFPIIPLISGGPGCQFLLHEDSLAEAIVRAIRGDFDQERRPLTLAHPEPVRFKDLMAMLATSGGRKVVFVPVSWRLIYLPLRLLEQMRLSVGFSSDSLVSFVFQNATPDFTTLTDYNITMVSFSAARKTSAAQKQP
jgi:nucleoside-diphosphate-sugar epimerase